MEPTEVRRELEATIEARRELGREHDRELAEAFVDRIEKTIDERIKAKLGGRERPQRPWGPGVFVALGSLGIMVPITEKASGLGEVAAWAAVVLVNAFYNLRRD